MIFFSRLLCNFFLLNVFYVHLLTSECVGIKKYIYTCAYNFFLNLFAVLFYRYESWTLHKQDKDNVEAIEMCMYGGG